MGTRQNRLCEAVLTSTQNLCFELKFEKMPEFLSETFQILVVKVSIYLNRCVFVLMNYKSVFTFFFLLQGRLVAVVLRRALASGHGYRQNDM